MAHMKLVAIIPLILSIGIIPALSFADHHLVMSPKKQMDEGTAPEDVVCKSELALMIRNTGAAACVKPDSVNKLENRGWNLLKEATMMGKHFSIELEDGVGVIGP